jgi:hypothetical protein
MTEKKPVGTVDITPTWSGSLRIMLAAIQNGTDEGHTLAMQELKRMAMLADRYGDAMRSWLLLSDCGTPEERVAREKLATLDKDDMRALHDLLRAAAAYASDQRGVDMLNALQAVFCQPEKMNNG